MDRAHGECRRAERSDCAMVGPFRSRREFITLFGGGAARGWPLPAPKFIRHLMAEMTAMNEVKASIALTMAIALLGMTSIVEAQQQPAQPAAPLLPHAPNMTFFVTGAGPGKGADLGGLEGADQHCQQLAQRHGAGGKTWHAYLSTQAVDGKPAINARDRIGNGPWQNFKGEVVAQNVDDLHSDNNKLGMNTSLTERGFIIPGVGFAPNRHDVLTGSTPEGRAFPAGEDRTCRNWTSSNQGGRCLATSTARVCAMMRPRGRGIHLIRRGARTAAAAKLICAAPAGMGCSIASLPSSKAVL